MDTFLRQRADLMAENYMELKRNFKWETTLANHFGAMVHTTAGKRVNAELLDEVRMHLKKETSWVSYFRGVNRHILSNLLCLEDNYRELFDKITYLYEKLRNAGFKNRTQLPLSAFTIARAADERDWAHRIERMNAFYQHMRENHFWITSSDDYVYAAILATTDLDVKRTGEELERCYELLSEEGFYKGNYLQTLSHILALGEESAELKCQKAWRIFKGLKAERCNPNYYGLASVGVLALLGSSTDKIISEVKETYDYIYEKDGYGFWSTDKNTRAIIASSLVSDYYLDGIEKGVLQVTLGNSISAIIIAQQSAAAVAACTAGAAGVFINIAFAIIELHAY